MKKEQIRDDFVQIVRSTKRKKRTKGQIIHDTIILATGYAAIPLTVLSLLCVASTDSMVPVVTTLIGIAWLFLFVLVNGDAVERRWSKGL